MISIDPEKKAEIDRMVALENLDFWFSNVVADGYTTEGGWKLGLRDSDVTLLTGQFVLAKEADAAGLPLPQVVDMAGVPHSFESLEDLTALMLAYGQYRTQISAEYATRKAAIESPQE